MQDFTSWLERHTEMIIAGLSFLFMGTVGGMDLRSAGGNSSRGTVIVFTLIYLSVVGIVDFLTPHEMNLQLLYLIGCAFAGWNGGMRVAVLIAAVAEVFCYCSDPLLNNPPPYAWIIYWNSTIRLAGFLTFGWLSAEIKRVRELEHTVQQRTFRLQEEAEEHKQTLTRLQEALQLFRQLTESITEVFWVTDPAKTRISYVSPEFEKVWGRTQQTAYTSPSVWLDSIHPEDRERVAEATRTKQVAGEYNEEFRVVRPDNTVRWVHERAFPVKNEGGKVYRIVGISEDITERKQVDETVRTQARVLESMAEAVLMSDPEGIIHLANPAAERMFGYESGELLGKSLAVLSGGPNGEPDDEFRAKIAGVKARGATAGEYLLRRKDGSQRLVETRSSGLTLGVEFYVVTVGQDISDRVRLERQILEISDREQARIGQDIHDDLCQKLISMAFDVNSIRQSLVERQSSESAICQRVSELLDETITESRRVARGLYPVRLETEGLVSALKELAQTTQERFRVPCVCDSSADEVVCQATTATHLYRIAQEALNNALKHSNAQHLYIRLSGSDGEIQLVVEDDGTGIRKGPADQSGMGLHIMDYRARALGGTLRIGGGKTSGTVVSCRVPITVN